MALMTDGFPTTIDIAGATLCEISVTPPGIEGGGENEFTCMTNVEWRTKFPKKLKSLTEASFSAYYDPATYDTILSQILINQLITITFPDSSTLAFWGWIESFIPGEISEGEPPEAEVTIIPSNLNDSLEETPPVYTSGTGT